MYLDYRIISFPRQQSTDIHLDFIGCGKPEQYNWKQIPYITKNILLDNKYVNE